MAYSDEELKKILQEDFIENYDAFKPGRRNDDMVDSMCICFALNEEWTEMYAKLADNQGLSENYFNAYLVGHYERVKDWLERKEASGMYTRGEKDIMTFAINY